MSLQSDQVEELIALVSALDRPGLAAMFRNYKARFPVDFTDAFLAAEPLDRLRHIFLAMCLQCQQMPAADAEAVEPLQAA